MFEPVCVGLVGATPFDKIPPFTRSVLGGSWGAFDAPKIVRVLAKDAHADDPDFFENVWDPDKTSSVGVSPGDMLVIEFDQQTNEGGNGLYLSGGAGLLIEKDADVRRLVKFNYDFASPPWGAKLLPMD